MNRLTNGIVVHELPHGRDRRDRPPRVATPVSTASSVATLAWPRGRASATLSADSTPAEVAQDEEHDQDNDDDRDDASHSVPPFSGSPRAHA
jgi:hypothetical protein